METTPSIEKLFEEAYVGFHSQFYREKDPVRFIHLYSEPKDQEIVGLLSALLAYGNVKIILSSISRILMLLDCPPSEAVEKQVYLNRLREFRHRFTIGADIEILFARLRMVYDEHGSLEAFFCRSTAPTMKERMSSFVQSFHSLPLPRELARLEGGRSRHLRYLLSDPMQGSACKRLNLFFRWMVRPSDGVDIGLWKGVTPAQLMLPVDTHILKIIRKLGWTRSGAATWKVVEEATERLRQLDPNDPIRYDFSLCHLLMEGNRALYEKMERRSVHQEGPPGKL